ncbi:putative Elongation factor 1-delta [Cocos nucifera]|uniref:Putative Elongation factor 1-delta n=1 Tax=Cocos nucifera TaxID=13894 RepID=A0A8K0N8M0_COCNU|nr:putative Elongation factor 1-delta [Cocos nucifera]
MAASEGSEEAEGRWDGEKEGEEGEGPLRAIGEGEGGHAKEISNLFISNHDLILRFCYIILSGDQLFVYKQWLQLSAISTCYQASKDDLAVYAALSTAPSLEYVNVARWYNHIDALLKMCGVTAEGAGVKIESSASVAEEAPSSPPVADKKAPAADDDDDDMDLFGEETEEEKKAAEERAAAVKASGKKKESGKSSVLLDVKPWDDETDMQKLEEAVRSVQMEGLLWGASKLAPVGYGIKKLQIMMTIVDDLVSVDSLIEDHLLVEPANEYIQSCDIVAFNKICEYA